MSRFFLRFTLLAKMLAALLSYAYPADILGGPTVTVGGSVAAARRIPVDEVDHAAWDALLKKYVDAAGLVDYRRWKASAADQALLDGYLSRLSAASFGRSASRPAQIAFWINAYNALTIKGILREYPTTSIRNHTATLFGYNIWKDLHLIVGDQSYSLEDIEHRVLRATGEPRIHFAIVCASLGCPRLLNEAYTPLRLDDQLTANARSFFADPSKFRADSRTSTVYVSPILKWFAEDFGADAAGRLRTIAPYTPAAAQSLLLSGRARIAYLDYDWNLNDQVQARTSAGR